MGGRAGDLARDRLVPRRDSIGCELESAGGPDIDVRDSGALCGEDLECESERSQLGATTNRWSGSQGRKEHSGKGLPACWVWRWQCRNGSSASSPSGRSCRVAMAPFPSDAWLGNRSTEPSEVIDLASLSRLQDMSRSLDALRFMLQLLEVRSRLVANKSVVVLALPFWPRAGV
jgi:hypothetical protein